MADTHAGNISLVGGVLALDFANTASGRETAEPTEHLRTPEDVVAFARHAGGIGPEGAKRAYASIAADGEAGATLLRHARELREAIYRTGSAIARGQAPPDTNLGTLKEFARRAMGQGKLERVSAGGYALGFSEAQPEVALLGPVAWSALDLLSKGGFERIKECPECGWLFVDQSKNNSRRWCDMATCGNRIKLRKHRERH